ncbi:Anthrone oxygenase [Microdochium nivale]|nr:Anthrone oxygenase [Microdochium nivale]
MAPPPPTASFRVATAIRSLQAASVIFAGTASGLSVGLSVFVVPRILELPTHLLVRHFNHVLDVARKLMPPMLLLPGLMNAALAAGLRWLEVRSLAGTGGAARAFASSRVGTTSSTLFRGLAPWKFYAAAAVVSFSMVPYTLIVMQPMDRMMVARNKYNSSSGGGSSSSGRENGPLSSATNASNGGRDAEKAADRLRKKMEAAETSAIRHGEMSSHAVVDRWGLVNLYRPAVSLISAAISIYATLW